MMRVTRHCALPHCFCRHLPVRQLHLSHSGVHALPAGPMVPYCLPCRQLKSQLGGVGDRRDAVCGREVQQGRDRLNRVRNRNAVVCWKGNSQVSGGSRRSGDAICGRRQRKECL